MRLAGIEMIVTVHSHYFIEAVVHRCVRLISTQCDDSCTENEDGDDNGDSPH